MTNFLRCCAGCNAHITIGYETERDAAVYCTKCDAMNKESWSDFDPQPRPGRDCLVRLYTEPGQWCVLARDGDMLTVRKMGFPDSESVEVHVANVLPCTDRRHGWSGNRHQNRRRRA